MGEGDGTFIDVPEMSEALGIPAATVYRYIKAGIIPAKRIRSRVLVHRAEFERWCQEGQTQEVSTTTPAIDLATLLGDGEVTFEVTVRLKRKSGLAVVPIRAKG